MLSAFGLWVVQGHSRVVHQTHHGPVSLEWDGRCLNLLTDGIDQPSEPQASRNPSPHRGQRAQQDASTLTSCPQTSWPLSQVEEQCRKGEEMSVGTAHKLRLQAQSTCSTVPSDLGHKTQIQR